MLSLICVFIVVLASSFYAFALPPEGTVLTPDWIFIYTFKLSNNSQTSIRLKSDDVGLYTIMLTNYASSSYNGSSYNAGQSSIVVFGTSASSSGYYGDNINQIHFTTSRVTSSSHYYSQIGQYIAHDISGPTYDCQGQTVQACIDDAFNYATTSTPDPHPLNFDLPAGNCIIIEVGSGSNILNLSTTSYDPYYSPTEGLNRISMTWSNSFPSSVSDPMRGNISWSGSGKPNLLNMYSQWNYSEDTVLDVDLAKYLIIINPMIDGYSTSEQVYNPWVEVSLQKVVAYWVYPLNTQITSSGINSTGGQTVYSGQYDDETGEWTTTNQNGDPVNPTTGGSNSIVPQTDTIQGWLKNIANSISGFFRGAIDSINILTSAISDFTGSLKSLYMWLPPQVMSIITSAIVISITIGVIKVFI